MRHCSRSMHVRLSMHASNKSKGEHVAEAPVNSTHGKQDQEVAEAHSRDTASELISHFKINSCSPKPFEHSYYASGPKLTNLYRAKLLLSLNVFS